MSDKPQTEEHRETLRRQTLMRAYILEPEVGIIGQCRVRDLSQSGAKLELDSELDLHEDLWLKIEQDPALRYCTVKWKKDRCLGVEFSLDRLIRDTEEEARKLRRDMSWSNIERRSGKDRRETERSSPDRRRQ